MKRGRLSAMGAALLLACAALIVPGTLLAGENEVGAAACATCHPAQYAAWSQGPHAKATSRLPEARQADARCTGCHATDARAGQVGVQCESCHGGGINYAKYFVMKDRELARVLGLKRGDMTSCQACHAGTGTKLVPFDAQRAWATLPHSKTGVGK